MPLLDAIEGQDLRPDEIIVVDDGSSDDTPSRAETWGCARPHLRVTIVPGPARGPGAAMNAGIRRAASDVIVRLDGHCRPHEGYLARSVDTLVRENAGVVGGVWEIEPGADTAVARAIAAVVAHPIGSGGAAYRDAQQAGGIIKSVETVPFGCFRRTLWTAIGGYDESLEANEDFDFNHRVLATGATVLLNTEIRSVYKARPTLRALALQYFRYGFWKARMLRKFPRSLRLRQLVPALFLPGVCLVGAGLLMNTGLLWGLLAAVYPALVVAAVIQMRAVRHELRLFLPAIASVVLQHAAWSAGFWRGVLYPSSKPTTCNVPPGARPGS